ncbi:MAG: hypothetical protein V3V14_13225 [Saprospiraceae bacterium]
MKNIFKHGVFTILMVLIGFYSQGQHVKIIEAKISGDFIVTIESDIEP